MLILSVQEDFLKLKTEFEVQMKWISSTFTEQQTRALDLTMIPQMYRHLIVQNPSTPASASSVNKPKSSVPTVAVSVKLDALTNELRRIKLTMVCNCYIHFKRQ